MANWYCSSSSWSAVTPWAASTAVSVGALRRQLATPTVGNERVWRCTTAGTTGASEPTWTLTKGSTTSDNGVVWTEVTGNESFQGPVGSIWTAPHARLETAFSWAAGADTTYVSSSHSQTQASAWSPAFPQNTICVTETTVPPTTANLSTGAVIATSGDNGMAPTFQSFFVRPYVYGIKFRTAVGAGAVTTASKLTCVAQAHDAGVFEKCDFEHAATGALSDAIRWRGDGTNFGTFVECTVKFGNVGSNLNVESVAVKGSLSTFLQGATIPTTLMNLSSGNVTFDGVDLTNVSGNLIDTPANYTAGYTAIRNCKLHASATPFVGPPQGRMTIVDFINCDSGSTTRHERYSTWGRNVKSTTVVRTGGANENSVPVSWKVTTNSAAAYNSNFVHQTFLLSDYNTTVGSSVNVTVEGIADPTQFSALPKNDEVWIEVGYPSDAGGSGLHTFSNGSKGSILATSAALTASTQAWDSAATARANSTAYSLGDIRKVASNPGRLFICTTAGTSSGSEPAGYASAVDGGSITDGTAVFKAMWRFKQTLAVTPQQVGYINVQVRAAKTSAVVYIDPLIVLS
jgi:hypothetical protein